MHGSAQGVTCIVLIAKPGHLHSKLRHEASDQTGLLEAAYLPTLFISPRPQAACHRTSYVITDRRQKSDQITPLKAKCNDKESNPPRECLRA